MLHIFVFCCLCCCRLVGVFGDTDAVKSVSVTVMEGDSVSLDTHVTEIQDINKITWKFGTDGSPIAKISSRFSKIFILDDALNGRFRDRLKVDRQTGSLTITNTRNTDSGVYEVDISRISSSPTTHRFAVTVYAHLPVTVISRNSSQCSSSSCSLVCSVVDVSHVTLSWYKGSSLLSSISVSDLSISLSLPLEVECQDKNTYSCVLNDPFSHQTRHPNITQHCHTCAGVFGDELKSVSVMEGESVTLQSGVTELQTDDEIMWRFGTNGPLIAKTNGVTNMFPDNLDGRFRDRLKLDKKTGSLTITNIRAEHSGVYEVEISTSSSETKHRFTVTVTGVFGVDELKSESVSVMEGESVTLQSGVTELQADDEIMWTFGANRNLLAKTNGDFSKISIRDDALDGRFRDRLKLDKKTGSLTITNTRNTDSGLYEVTISTSSSETKHRFTVTVTGVFRADAVKSVTEGESVTLNTGLTEIQTNDQIDWRFGPKNIIIAKIYGKDKKIVLYEDGADGRFRGRLKLDHQTGSLTITNTRSTDSGLYKVSRTSTETPLNTFNLTVYGVFRADAVKSVTEGEFN